MFLCEHHRCKLLPAACLARQARAMKESKTKHVALRQQARGAFAYCTTCSQGQIWLKSRGS
jgi:hypothetical protein